MAYRVIKKTNKKTVYACLDCRYCKKLEEKCALGCMVECQAENRCVNGPFNARDFYCVEVKSINDMNDSTRERTIKDIQTKSAKENYKEYLKKFYTKKMAKEMYEKRYK